ncbi:MAG: long-chain fatty acid--CoA ligase [Anaerolineae bacterium]|nr:long-chain fatty acid--CoA ligase [Anaerolineae bacterium]
MHAADLLTDRARLTPDREALLERERGRRYTYAELNTRACRAANFLQEELGVQAGDRVSILAHNSVAYVDLLYGLAKIGAILAPLNWRLVATELAYILNDCQPRVVIVGPEFAATWAGVATQVDVEHVLGIEDAEVAGAGVYEDGLAAASPQEPARPATLNAETPLCILYTSGTTGRPKGAVIPHRQVLWNCINTVISWGLTENDVAPVFTPMFHAGGLFIFLTPLFYAGGRIVLTRTFDVDDSLRVIGDERCTAVLGVPTLFQMWRQAEAYRTAGFGHVRFFVSGGAPCPPELMASWRAEKGIVFRQGYGLTEVGTNCFSMTDAESAPKTGTVGKPIFHSKMRLVDGDDNDVPPGEVGELLIRGPHVFSGYRRNPEATAEALVDGWFHTGDMARRDEEGFYTIVGRSKDMIISGGENVYAAEVEAAFREHPAVAEAALIGQPDETWGEVGLMVVVPQPGVDISAAELTAFCRERLARYKVPKAIVFAPELPYSPYGKVEKRKLRQQYVAAEETMPQTEGEAE